MKRIAVIVLIISLFILTSCTTEMDTADDDTEYYGDRIAELEYANEELEDRVEELESQIEDLQNTVWDMESYLENSY